jgi:SAM-dependent methyltransferase
MGSTHLAQQRYDDGTYREHNPTWHDEDAGFKGRHVARLLRDNGIQPTSICDVGCGTGGVLARLREDFAAATLVGWEVSTDAITLARSLHPDIEIRSGDFLESGGTHDLVLALDVIEHVEDYFGFLRALLPHGNRFVFHIPLDLSVLSVARLWPLMKSRVEIGHIHSFLKPTAVAVLQETGYRIEASRYTHIVVDQPTTLNAKLLRWPRRLGMRISPDRTAQWLGGCSLLVLASRAG